MANVTATNTTISPENGDQLLGREAWVEANGIRGPGAGNVRSCALARADAAGRPEAVVRPDLWLARCVPCRRLATAPGSRVPSAGVAGPAAFPPVADGISSQYWLTALIVGSEQNAPGWPDAAALADPWRSSAALNRPSSACLSLGCMPSGRW